MPLEPKIVDVRLDTPALDTTSVASLRASVLEGLNQPQGKKYLPTLLLYDESGLRLYDEITTGADEYYLFPLEEAILKTKGGEIVQAMHGTRGVVEGEVILELGAGALRKTSHLLHNLANLVSNQAAKACSAPAITYYALDLERRELVRTLNQITMDGHHHDNAQPAVPTEDYGALGTELDGKVAVRGMWGTYDGGIHFINQGGLQKLRTADEAEVSALITPRSSNNRRDSDSKAGTSPYSKSSGTSSSEAGDSLSPYTTSTPPSPLWSSPEHNDLQSETAPPLHILFLGSSLGNFSREEMPVFLRRFPLRPGSGDTLLLGLDGDNDKELIEKAYNDYKGITKTFIMNGLKGAGRALGDESLFVEGQWEYVNFYNVAERRHEAYYKSVGAQRLEIPATDGKGIESIVEIADRELINIEVSHKYSREDIIGLFSDANLRIIQEWRDPNSLYGLFLLERPPFHFPLVKAPTSPSEIDVTRLLDEPSTGLGPYSVPTIKDWQEMWSAWDFITLKMIPPSMLHQKPIDLRHKCLFYLGHIPTFLDIHLSRLLREPNTEPEHYKYVFERGIDPHVDDPNQCHPHSEVPDKDEDWPTLGNILDFRDRVRQRLLTIYSDLKSGKRTLDRKTARVLFMTHEHEGFHAETLLYMLIQRAGTGTLPPSLFVQPNFKALGDIWDEEYMKFYSSSPLGKTVTIGPTTVVLGHDDLEADDVKVPFDPIHAFGWDNENPRREVQVPQFKISWRPVTNGEFFAHWSDPAKNQGDNEVDMPASWVEVEGKLSVRTLYGPVDFDIAKHWPVQTVYDDLSIYARVQGGRLPTFAELRAFWERYQDGFVGSANVGFRNWHPTPATTGVTKGGRGHNGGLWEWTSTILDNYEGFVPSNLYPGYSMDFFDQKHHIVIGGSYATIPRIAQRASVCNFYQHNYPYAWVGGRVVYDVHA